jgi:uncharacterized membrane protein
MSDQTAEKADHSGLQNFMDELPTDRLKQELGSFLGALAQRATSKLTDYAENGGPAAKALKEGGPDLLQGKPLRGLARAGFGSVTGMVSKSLGGDGGKGGGKSGGKGLKVTNIVEQIDIGAPLDLTYNVWTQFQDFPTFMKKVETVSQEEDAKLNWKAQVFLSHRGWRSTIMEQIPDKRIVWKSEGDKGYVDGTVTFHALGQPEFTRVLVDLEYHPGGVVENVGNLWRAQGRRVRLELKHFRRHVMTQVITNPDEITGWRGEIRDGEVVSDGDDYDDRADEDYDEYEDHDEDSDRGEDEDEYEDRGYAGDEYDDDRDLDDRYEEDSYEEDSDEDEDRDDMDDEDGDEPKQHAARRNGDNRRRTGRPARDGKPVTAGSRRQ